MADIFTDSQVSPNPLSGLKHFITMSLLLVLFSGNAQQTLSTENKKAIKLYESGQAAAASRHFRTAIDLFKEAIKKDPYFQEPYLKMASIYNIYQQKDSALLYYDGYVQITPEEKVDAKIWKTLAQLQFSQGNYGKADQALMVYLSKKPEMAQDPELDRLQQSIVFSKVSIKSHEPNEITPLPPSVNRWKLQYFPVLTGDSRRLIFTKRDSDQAYSDEDLVFSVLSDSGWTEAQPISKSINTKLNEGAATVSADGRTLIFTSCDGRQSFGSCDLYISRREGDIWTVPENLGSQINTDKWESQPALSADGRTLYFSSNRNGGFGKRDIWVSTSSNGMWSKPVNLGPSINTKQDETTPFIHANSQTLFFASDGHIGLGGFDIFSCEKNGNSWTKPRNLGYPYNTYLDEYSLFISADGSRAFFSQEVKSAESRTEIVQFDITLDTLIKARTTFVMGLVLNKETNKPLRANIEMKNLEDSTESYEVLSDSISGTYFLTLTEGRDYAVFASKANYLFEDFNYKTKSGSLLSDTIHIYLQPIKPGSTVVLENIYFDFDKYDLKAESKAELMSIVAYLRENPSIRFMIEGHTDNQGAKQYNLDLSKNRAKAVFDFLSAQGIDPARMTYKGFGSLIPIASNDSEEGQKRNRRIAFRVLH